MAQVTECSARVTTIEEYLSAIDKVFAAQGSDTELWYRGQAQKGFNLTPSIARGGLNPLFEVVLLSKFKSLAIPYVEPLPGFPLPNGIPPYWHWLFLMQHYGVPTRLMDWSRDALTALFFATDPTDPSLTPGIDATVWVLKPTELNKAFTFYDFLKPGYIPNVEEPAFNQQFGPDAQPASLKAAAAIGPLNNTRIAAQRGVFTVFPKEQNVMALNLFDDSSDFLVKICIAWESFALIQTQLRHYGVTRLSLFPEIEKVAGEIAQQVKDEGILDPPAAP